MSRQEPTYHHTPVKPSRQPSRMAVSRSANGGIHDQPRRQQMGAPSGQEHTTGAASSPSPYFRETLMPNPHGGGSHDAPASASASAYSVGSGPSFHHNNYDYGANDVKHNQYSGSIRSAPAEHGAFTGSAGLTQDSGLRHRTGDSISRTYGGASPYIDDGAAASNFSLVHPPPSFDAATASASVLSAPFNNKQPAASSGGILTRSHAYPPDNAAFSINTTDLDQMPRYPATNPRYRTSSFGNGSGNFESFEQPGYSQHHNLASGDVQLSQGPDYTHDAGHEFNTIDMNGYDHIERQQGGPYESSMPNLPYSNMNANMSFASADNAYKEGHFGGGDCSYGGQNQQQQQQQQQGPFVGGFAGFAAPGTVIARPLQQVGYASHYDPRTFENARQRLMRRRTVKKIALTNGNLVIDLPVPSSICKGEQDEEFRCARYTAVTCDPNDYIGERYALRQFIKGRQTELAICMTCYNEDEQLLYRTLGAVIRNIGYLQGRTRSTTWGDGSWSKVVVFIVGDGRKKANERMLKMLACYGVYSEGVMKDHVLSKETTAHIFELTTQVIVEPEGGVEVAPCPVQLVFCLKEKNEKKINSHRWFFRAFCAQLQPNVTVLLDVGTKPTGTSIYHLWKAFDKNSKVAGACGEIAVDTGTLGWRLYNPLVAAQNFEYKMSNILDKPLESVFGFIGVLPGAFSAYRWKALKGRPLEAYFKGESLHNGTIENPGAFASNMFLAEDRILCFELVVKKGEAWILKYVKAAKATTDVPDGVAELIGQRRRWLNGSLFAGIFALLHFGRIWTSGQSFLRKILLQLQVIYNLAQLVLTASGVANCFLASYFLIKSATSNPNHDPFVGYGPAVFNIILNVYLALIVVVTVASLGSRPAGFRALYMLCILLFAALFCLLLYCVGWTVYLQLDAAHLFDTSGWTASHLVKLLTTSENIRSIILSIAATYGLYLIASLVYLEPWHMLTSFVQALVLSPFFITVLSIYSMANLHDVSWGTKGSDAAASDLGGATGAADKKEGHTIVTVKVPTSASDAEELWQHAQADLARKAPEKKEHRSKSVKQSDAQANFRTKFLLCWLAFNGALIIVFTSQFWDDYTRDDLHLTLNPYLAALFWSTAVLSAVRATGAFLYLIFRLFGH